MTSGRQVVLSGRIAGLIGPDLVAAFEAIHLRIVKQQIVLFTVNVCDLEFVNSSAIRVFIDWVTKAQAAPYKLVFLTDYDVTWQRLSFSVLHSLAPDVVEIRSTGSAGG